MLKKLAFRQLWQRPLTTALLLLIIALAVGTGVLLTSLTSGVQRALTTATEPFSLLIGSPGSAPQLVLNSVFLQDRPLSNIPYSEVDALRQKTKLVNSAVPLAFGDSYNGYRIVGTEPAIFQVKSKPSAPEWLQVTDGRQFQGPFEAVIGSAVAKQSGLQIGSKFYSIHGVAATGGHQHKEHAFTVVGILAPTGGPYDQAVLTDISSIYALHEKPGAPPAPKAVTAIMVEPVGYAQAYTLAAQYQNRHDVQLVFPAQVIVQLFNMMGRGEKLWQPFGYFVVVLAVAVVILTSYLATVTNLRNYAILQALGATNGMLYRILLLQIGYLIVVGTALGCALGYGLYVLLAHALASSTAVTLPLSIAPQGLLLAGACVVTGLISGVLPIYAFRKRLQGNLSTRL